MLAASLYLHSNLSDFISLAKQMFVDSHSQSCSKEDMDAYLRYAFAEKKIKEELANSQNLFHFLYNSNELIGYSKLILSLPFQDRTPIDVAKLERIYIRQDVFGVGAGQFLFEHNKHLAIENNQGGIWLYTWIGNQRAIRFYQKNGFEIIDFAEFKISKRHTNPNHIMYLSL